MSQSAAPARATGPRAGSGAAPPAPVDGKGGDDACRPRARRPAQPFKSRRRSPASPSVGSPPPAPGRRVDADDGGLLPSSISPRPCPCRGSPFVTGGGAPGRCPASTSEYEAGCAVAWPPYANARGPPWRVQNILASRRCRKRAARCVGAEPAHRAAADVPLPWMRGSRKYSGASSGSRSRPCSSAALSAPAPRARRRGACSSPLQDVVRRPTALWPLAPASSPDRGWRGLVEPLRPSARAARAGCVSATRRARCPPLRACFR